MLLLSGAHLGVFYSFEKAMNWLMKKGETDDGPEIRDHVKGRAVWLCLF